MLRMWFVDGMSSHHDPELVNDIVKHDKRCRPTDTTRLTVIHIRLSIYNNIELPS